MKVNGEEVSVSLPTMQVINDSNCGQSLSHIIQAESADDVVLFKGAKRTCTKECILIINTLTGVCLVDT